MACETTTDTPINVNPVDVITIIKQDNNIRSTEKQHITNRAMTGVRAYTLVGPSANMSDPYTSEYITMQPLAVYTLLYKYADVRTRTLVTKPRNSFSAKLILVYTVVSLQ